MPALDWQAALTAGVMLALLATVIATRLPLDLVFVAALSVLVVAGVIDAGQAFAGLANPGFLTVAFLYIVVAGIRDTGGVQWIVHNLLGQPRSTGDARARVTLPVAGFSAFLNNTPVVAMMIPAVSEWARRFSLRESKLFIPLSYAAILGGTCTLLGTSTNLVVDGLLIDRLGDGLGIFDITPVGLVVLAAGMLFLFLAADRLLPDRAAAARELENPREYTVEMLVTAGPLVGRTIESAGLRRLPNCFLIEIDRGEQILPAVAPHERLQEGDRLVFAGPVSAVLDLRAIRGLVPATDQVFKLGGAGSRRQLVEAVVSDQCPLAGQTIREGGFRSRYGAAVIAVARGSHRMPGKVGDIRLQPGDVLMLEAGYDFIHSHRHRRDFLLTRHIQNSEPPRHERAGVAAAILAGMVALAATGVMPMAHAALAAAVAMVATRCVTGTAARSAMDFSVLIVIAAAFGLSEAMAATGLAGAVANAVFGLAAGGPDWAYFALAYILAAVLSAVMTNNAAAVLIFPIAFAAASNAGVDPIPVAVAVMFGASASFATPMAYQTNLMVMGAGGYRFADFVRIGAPMTLVTGAAAIAAIAFFFGA